MLYTVNLVEYDDLDVLRRDSKAGVRQKCIVYLKYSILSDFCSQCQNQILDGFPKLKTMSP